VNCKKPGLKSEGGHDIENNRLMPETGPLTEGAKFQNRAEPNRNGEDLSFPEEQARAIETKAR
jgi:hypothetical protein